MVTRRRFLTALVPGLVLASGGLLVYGYRYGGCPLASGGFCDGPCTAIRDADGNILCDRISPAAASAGAAATSGAASAPAAQMTTTSEPTAATGAATPADSQTPTASMEDAPEPTTTPTTPSSSPTAVAQPQVACPYGLINDPYPGQCRRYVDRNGNGVCDLSEPQA